MTGEFFKGNINRSKRSESKMKKKIKNQKKWRLQKLIRC